jgi:hypothetical protein
VVVVVVAVIVVVVIVVVAAAAIIVVVVVLMVNHKQGSAPCAFVIQCRKILVLFKDVFFTAYVVQT